MAALIVGLLVTVDGGSHVVHAQSASERNQSLRLFRRAQRDYRDGRFLEAAAKLERAYELFAEPILLYNLGRAYDGGGRLEEARSAYTRFVEDRNSNPEDVRAARARLVVLDGLLESLQRAEQRDPDPTDTTVAPIEGVEASETTLVQPDASSEPCVGEACEAEEPEPLRDRPTRVAPIVLLSSAAVAAVAGLGMQLRSARMIDASTSQERADELGGRRRSLAFGGVTALGAAGALALGGLIAFVVVGGDDDAPVVSMGLGSVHVRGAF